METMSRDLKELRLVSLTKETNLDGRWEWGRT